MAPQKLTFLTDCIASTWHRPLPAVEYKKITIFKTAMSAMVVQCGW